MTSELQQKIIDAQTVHGKKPSEILYSFQSLADVMNHHRAYDEKTWLIYYDEYHNRTEISYRTFIYSVGQCAGLLQQLGISRGDRIATMSHNHPDTIVIYFAAWAIGACVVPLNMTEDTDRLGYVLENCGAKVIFCREEYREICDGIIPDSKPTIITLYRDTTIKNGFHDRIAQYDDYTFSQENMMDCEALIVYTSGTTGNPKGVVLVQRNLFADAVTIADWHGIDEHQRMMCVLPVHHVNGCIVTHITPFIAGASVVLNRKFQTEYFFRRIADEHVNIVSVVPTLLAFLLDAKADDMAVKNKGFRHIICGAGPLTVDLAKHFYDYYAIPIIHGYGLSETTCYSCFIPADLSEHDYKRWMIDEGFPSIGIPLPCNEMAIHDDKGNTMQERERGEIVIRGTNVMKEYYNNISANEATFAFSWFRSGDEGFFVYDEQQRPYFFITGRIKELIIRGGVNLAPLEIDEIINSAPGVKAGISVGFENDFYGEEVGALIIPEHNAVSKDDILAYCRKHLPFHKSPKVIVYTDALPVTSTGKYQRNKVKHIFSEWKAIQFKK